MDGITETPLPKRYKVQAFVESPNARIKHFEPGKNGRDRFGNRIFTSPDLAYIDRMGDEVKAGLLVSPEGERFIRDNTGIIRDIERGLIHLENYLPPIGVKFPENIDLGNNRILRRFKRGGQSRVYLLEVNGIKYIIKTKETVYMAEGFNDVSQPYINEMLQGQEVQSDLEADMKRLNIRFPTYLFASGQISCSVFEEGIELGKLNQPVRDFHVVLRDYVSGKKNSNLWQGIHVDTDKRTNWIISGDHFVCIDPFYFTSSAI